MKGYCQQETQETVSRGLIWDLKIKGKGLKA